MDCPRCGKESPDHALKCAACGQDLTAGLGETVANGGRAPLFKTARSPLMPPTEIQPQKPGPFAHRAGFGEPTEYDSSGRVRPSSPSATGALRLRSVFANRYEILELLGEGGMGRVYKARDQELDKVIALKTIRVEMGNSPELVQRFKQELVLARKITHKNVIRIHDLGEAEGIKFFTMEFIEGHSLKGVIRGRGKIPLDEAVPVARQILSALGEAHGQGVIHRDLKPQNIMIDRDGAPRVMDFGIARAAGETSGMTDTGMVMGTPDYMSPEQVRGEKAGPSSDLYSFGVILYEMLTGELPFKAETPLSKVMMRLSKKPTAPRQLNTDIPEYLEAVVLKCMEVDPTLRYQSAAEVLKDLDRERVDRSLTQRLRKAVVARKMTFAALAVLVVGSAAAVYFASRSGAPPPGASGEGQVTTLAILPFTNATGSSELEWMRTGLPEMLVTDVAQSRYVRPVPGERVLKVMHDLGIAEDTRFDQSALELVSQRAPAQTVLYGQYVESGGALRLDLTLRKAGSGVPIPVQVEGSARDLFGLVDQITARIKAELDLTPEQVKGDTDRPITEVTTASLEAMQDYHAGLAELRRGANQAAIPLLKGCVALDPDFAMAHAKLAEAYLNAGEDLEARAAIDRAGILAERSGLPMAERYLIHATAARVRDDYEMAVGSYGELAKLYPQDPDILLSLGRALEELGQFPEALEAYQNVVQMAPDYVEAQFGMSWVLVFSGRPAEAIDLLEKALAAGRLPGDPETQGTVHSILGLAYRETFDYEESMKHYQLCLDSRRQGGDLRGQAVALARMAPIHVERGETDKALRALRDAVAISRKIGDRESESDFLLDTGFVYQEAGNLDRALARFKESMQIEMERQDHSRLANRLNTIAELYRLKGQYDDAIIYLEQAKSHLAQTEDKRDKAINFQNIGSVRKAQGLYAQSVEAFLQAQSLFDEVGLEAAGGGIQLDLAEIYETQGRYADAHRALQRSLKAMEQGAGHDIARAKAGLGRLLTTLGKLDEAEKAFSEAGGGDTHEGHTHGEDAGGPPPEVLLGLARLAQQAGRMEEAAATYEKANIDANLSGRKDVAVESRIALGRLYLAQGKIPNSERLLTRTRQEAAQARLRPLEAEAALALANVHLAKGDAESCRKAALEAIRIAESFEGRPVLYGAEAVLGKSYESLGRSEEALDAYAKAVSVLDWIRGGLLPEHVESFMSRPDIRSLLEKAVVALERGGRGEGASLRKWVSQDRTK